MSTVTANNTANFTFNQVLSYGIGQSQTVAIPMALRSLFTGSGVAADKCDLLYAKTLTFVASTPQTLDLQALVDVFGAAISFARVRFLAIRNNAAVDGQVLLVGAAGANEWDGLASAGATITVYPASAANDGFAVFQMPATTGAVVNSTHHLLKLDPGANAFTVDLLIGGCDS